MNSAKPRGLLEKFAYLIIIIMLYILHGATKPCIFNFKGNINDDSDIINC